MSKKEFIPNLPFQELSSEALEIPVKDVMAGIKVEKVKRVRKPKADILTTGVPTPDIGTAIQHLYDFTTRNNGAYSYAMVMEEEDSSLTLVERVGMPCWGAIREYQCGTRPDDIWPTDLRAARHRFPVTGKPVAISFEFLSMHNRGSNWYASKDQWNRFITEFAFNAEVSPWKSVLKDIELTIKDEWIVGVVFKDTNIDPTVLVSLMRNCGDYATGVPKHMQWEGLLALRYLIAKRGGSYGFSPRICLDRFVDGNPFDLSNGGTFYERESYNRPDIDYVFGGKANVGIMFSGLSYDKLLEEYEKTHVQQEVA